VATDCPCGCRRRLRGGRARAAREGVDIAARVDELEHAPVKALPHLQDPCDAFARYGRDLVEVWFQVTHGERQQPPELYLDTRRYLDITGDTLDLAYLPNTRPGRSTAL